MEDEGEAEEESGSEMGEFGGDEKVKERRGRREVFKLDAGMVWEQEWEDKEVKVSKKVKVEEK